MGKIIAWIIGIVVVLSLIGKCAGPSEPLIDDSSYADSSARMDPNMARDPATATTGPTGEAISVPSDPRASFQLLSWSKLPNGNLQAVTRRDGPSGTSYARREIDCDAMTFRYLGEGDTLEQAMEDVPNPGEMGELTEKSISTYVSEFACGKAGA